jgi:hypothetical protein
MAATFYSEVAPMNSYDEKAKRLREDMLAASAPDPVLTFEYIKADLGLSHSGFYRGPRQELPTIQISPRRLGVLRSDYLRWKAGRITPGRAA